jgi:hypothetical protein
MKNDLREGIKLYDEVMLDASDPEIEHTIVSRFDSTIDVSEAKIFIILTNSYMASIILSAGDKHNLGGSGYG